MAASKKNTYLKHKRVRAEFERLKALKIYRYNHILTKVAEKFFLAESTVEKILAKDDDDPSYGNPEQLKLFEKE